MVKKDYIKVIFKTYSGVTNSILYGCYWVLKNLQKSSICDWIKPWLNLEKKCRNQPEWALPLKFMYWHMTNKMQFVLLEI